MELESMEFSLADGMMDASGNFHEDLLNFKMNFNIVSSN